VIRNARSNKTRKAKHTVAPDSTIYGIRGDAAFLPATFSGAKKPRRYRIFRSDSGAAWRIVTVRRRSPIPGGLRSLQQIVEQTIDGHIKLGVVFVLPAGDGFFHLRDLVDADVAVFGELEKMA